MTTVNVTIGREISTYVEEDVDIDIDDIDTGIRQEDKAKLIAKLGGDGLLGDGDVARRDNIIERAYTAALNMPELPREIRDLFWLVHDRAL